MESPQTPSSDPQRDHWFRVMDAQLRVLDRERQKFVAVVNQTDTLFFVVDADANVTWMNRALAAQFEGADDDPRGTVPLAEVYARIGAEYVGGERCPVRRAFRENAVVHDEPAPRPGVRPRQLLVKVLPIQGTDGRCAEVLVVVQDVGDLEVLRRSEARYRRLFERSPDAMLMAEPESGRILLANRVAAALTGIARHRLLDLTLEALHDPAEWKDAFAEYRDVCGRDETLVRERTIVGVGGRRLVGSVSAARFDLDGRPVILLEIRDMTATKRLEAEARHAQRMEALGRLAGGVAHDFNNLLSVVLGKTELLASRAAPDAKTAEALDTIRKAALRGSLLTRQLLAFSRKEVVKRERVDLGEIVRDARHLLGNLLGPNVALRLEVAAGCGIRGDREQLEQVLLNLVVNAREAKPLGGTVTVRVAREEGSAVAPAAPQVLLEVHDEGPGLDPAVQSRLFEPFFTTKPHGEGGLGLSAVYGIVKESGGTIDVDSRPGEGTTFRLRFPLVEEEPAVPTPDPHPPPPCGGASGRILLVEDEDDVRAMTAEALEISGYLVTQAANAEEARAIWARSGESFALLLTDVVMPGMSGGELAQHVRRTHPHTPVLYMSGYNDDAIVRHGVSLSEAEFLAKPFTLDALARKVRGAIEGAPTSAGEGASRPPRRSAQASSSSTLRP